MLQKKTKYAIKALLELAKRYKEPRPMRISEISETAGIPRKFLEAILVELRDHGLVASKMGVTGGYYLVQHPEEIMLSNVIRLTRGPISLLPCVSLNFYERCKECVSEEDCGLRHVIMDVRDASIKILSKTSLSDILMIESKLIKKNNSSKINKNNK